MTGNLPEIYPDELLYSTFARFFIHSGCFIYRQMAEALFANPTEHPDLLFVNHLNPEVKGQLAQQKSWEEVIRDHTMFLYYGRFLGHERREQALNALINMEGNYYNLLGAAQRIPLCYCPLCAREDRRKYGEAYWHRAHQMEGVGVCPIHGCYLKVSGIMTGTAQSPKFYTAELQTEDQEVRQAAKKEWEFAQYVCQVFQKKEMPNGMKGGIGRYLDQLLTGTPYKSRRGQQRKVALLEQDYRKYFGKDFSGELLQVWQIQKIFTGYRFRVQEICGLAMFLGVSPKELTEYRVPEGRETTTVEEFDSLVRKMQREGVGVNETARRLGVGTKTIRDIRDGKKGARHRKTPDYSRRTEKRDWAREDMATLPKVKQCISELLGETGERPRRITANRIKSMLKLPEKRIEKLERCRKEVEMYQESTEEYWARELKWSLEEIERQGETLNWKHIRNLTNMRKSYVEACVQFLDEPTQKKIQEIL